MHDETLSAETRLLAELDRVSLEYKKLEKKYHNLLRKQKERSFIMSKQSEIIRKLQSDNKQGYVNKGKRRR